MSEHPSCCGSPMTKRENFNDGFAYVCGVCGTYQSETFTFTPCPPPVTEMTITYHTKPMQPLPHWREASRN